ncbi:aldo/keto reductase [Oenococcus alcoholitolerans]|uniref:aldo/keto reductase n=1 Tax=Oenococcus alcoholitolerans TaxID=931074 RepID=UPI003F722979
MKTVLDEKTNLNNGTLMPVFGLGVWRSSNTDAKNSVSQAIQHGYRMIDTARQYGNQFGVGRGIADGLTKTGLNRKDLFVTSKVFNGDQGYDSTLRGFEKTLKELSLNYLDLYLVHWPVDGRYLDTWKALEKLYRDGRIRAIGVSNFDKERLERVLDRAEIVPTVDQLEFNPIDQEKDIRPLLNLAGIQLEAWSPLGGGSSLNDPVIGKIADKYGKTSAQVILRWNYQQGIVTIPKSTHKERIIENSQIDDFKLDNGDIDAINELDQEKRSLWYDDFFWHNPNGQKDSIDKWDDSEKFANN